MKFHCICDLLTGLLTHSMRYCFTVNCMSVMRMEPSQCLFILSGKMFPTLFTRESEATDVSFRLSMAISNGHDSFSEFLGGSFLLHANTNWVQCLIVIKLLYSILNTQSACHSLLLQLWCHQATVICKAWGQPIFVENSHFPC